MGLSNPETVVLCEVGVTVLKDNWCGRNPQRQVKQMDTFTRGSIDVFETNVTYTE